MRRWLHSKTNSLPQTDIYPTSLRRWVRFLLGHLRWISTDFTQSITTLRPKSQNALKHWRSWERMKKVPFLCWLLLMRRRRLRSQLGRHPHALQNAWLSPVPRRWSRIINGVVNLNSNIKKIHELDVYFKTSYAFLHRRELSVISRNVELIQQHWFERSIWVKQQTRIPLWTVPQYAQLNFQNSRSLELNECWRQGLSGRVGRGSLSI